VNANGESVNSSQVAARPNSSVLALAVNSGGSAAGSFAADASFSGGTAASTSSTIDMTSVVNAAPQAVYQTERYGNFTYTLGGLTAGANYQVRLHFAEFYWSGVGQRKFNVTINGTQVLSNFDILAAAGGPNKATIEEFTATANASGQIVIQYTTVVDNAKSSGIEIRTLTGVTPPASPANLSAVQAAQKRRINLTWTQSPSGGITQNKVYRSTPGPSGPYSLRATLSAATSYSDTGLTSGQTYYYVVTAVNANAESAYSNYSGATAK